MSQVIAGPLCSNIQVGSTKSLLQSRLCVMSRQQSTDQKVGSGGSVECKQARKLCHTWGTKWGVWLCILWHPPLCQAYSNSNYWDTVFIW